MVDGPPEEGDGGGPEEGPVLSPEELDITDDESVRQLDEGRFVVSPDADSEPAVDTGPDPGAGGDRTDSSTRSIETDAGSRDTTAGESAAAHEAGELTEEDVHDWLREHFEGRQSRYAFDVTATFEGSVSQRQMASNDVVTIFESLLLWYAQQIDSNTPVEEILGILLMESNVPIRYPPESVRNLVKSAGLGPDDSIRDLLAAVEDEDGLEL